MAVRVSSDEFGIADRVELAHQRVSLGNVYRFAFGVVTIEFKDSRGLGAVINPAPAKRRDVFQCAVQQDAFRMGIVLTVIVWQPAKLSKVAKSLEMTVYEDVSMIVLRIANPHESAVAGDGAVVEERRSAT